MSKVRKRHHININVQKRGLTFAKCLMCQSVKDLILKLGKNSNDAREYDLKLKKHLLHQKLCKILYHTWRSKFVFERWVPTCYPWQNGLVENCIPKVVGGKQNDLWAWTIAHYLDGYDNSWSWWWEICTIFQWVVA
jgi:hypothetical protein